MKDSASHSKLTLNLVLSRDILMSTRIIKRRRFLWLVSEGRLLPPVSHINELRHQKRMNANNSRNK